MKQILAAIVCSSLLLVISSTDTYAKIYRYVDEKGATVFVDNESMIPQKYRTKTSTIQEATDSMTPEERKAYENKKRLEKARAESNKGRDEQRKAKALKKKARQTNVKIENNSVIVPVKMTHNNRTAKLNLVLDTGASETTVYYPALKKRMHFRRAELGFVQLAGGYVIPKVKVKFYKVEIGPFVEEYMPISIIDSTDTSIDGLLGMDFLMNHKYDIDYKNSVITWGN